MSKKLLKLKPAIKNYLWGGNRLKVEFNKYTDEDIVAETWELSCHPEGSAIVSNGDFAGKSLDEYIKIKGKRILGTNCEKYDEFPILVKFIDAKKNLSIQVHPNDEYALKNENQYGKTEMWYVIDAKEGAFLYYGLNKDVTDKELKEHIEKNTLLEILNKVFVKKGDVFFIEAGTIHAIGEGILMAEIQQSSNVTYRVYDYDRKDKNGILRELHLAKSIDVINKKKINNKHNFGNHLVKCEYFQVDKHEINVEYIGYANYSSFHSLLFIEGEGKIRLDNSEELFSKGDSIFIEAGAGKYEIYGNCEVLLIQVP